MTETTSDARSAIFASIRENLAASLEFDDGRFDHFEDKPLASSNANAASLDIFDVFLESLDHVGAKHCVVQDENEAADKVHQIISELTAENIVVSDSDLVDRVASKASIATIQNASREELFAADVGITSAQWAIAQTGTLVLESGAESHRLVSLVPSVHICILNAGSIRRSMSEILDSANTDKNPAITFITGASRTSDIELTLAIGVHGPRELYVIVIKDK